MAFFCFSDLQDAPQFSAAIMPGLFFKKKIGSEALAGLELVSQTDFDILAIILSYLPKGGCDFRNRPMCLA